MWRLLRIVWVLGWLGFAAWVEAGDVGGVVERFRGLDRSVEWRKVGEVVLDFETYHPQGMVWVGDRFFLSSVEVINRAKGEGRGHLFEVGRDGKLRRSILLGEGAAYHPGGIDFDGERLWVSVAEYRPDSWSVVYRVDPVTLEVERVFDFADHVGALVCDRGRRLLVGVSWGSRRLYRWELDEGMRGLVAGKEVEMRVNGSFYVDYQDGLGLAGSPYALFGGLSTLSGGGESVVLGGLELVDLREMRPVHQVPVMLRTEGGRSMLQNPWSVEVWGGGLRFYFIPEDGRSVMYLYDVIPE